MGKGISTAEGRLNLGTEVPYEGSPPLHVEVMAKLDQPNISEPSRQRSNSQNHCAEVLGRGAGAFLAEPLPQHPDPLAQEAHQSPRPAAPRLRHHLPRCACRDRRLVAPTYPIRRSALIQMDDVVAAGNYYKDIVRILDCCRYRAGNRDDRLTVSKTARKS